jgi:MYXO-CTERM domain-containing protein
MSCGTSGFSAYGSTRVQWGNVPPPTLTASKIEARFGDNMTLTWASADGSTCYGSQGFPGDGWEGPHGATGSMDLRATVTGTTYFVLVCGQSAPSGVEVKINPGPPPSVQLVADPTSVVVGEPVTLTWTTTTDQGCTASGGVGTGTDGWSGSLAATGGSMTVRQPSDGRYTYTITCYGLGGTGLVFASADVLARPPMATTAPAPSNGSSSSSGGGGGGGAMGPIDVAFFLAAALAGLWRRRRLAAPRSTFA